MYIYIYIYVHILYVIIIIMLYTLPKAEGGASGARNSNY